MAPGTDRPAAWRHRAPGLPALRSPLVLVALPTAGRRFLSSGDHHRGTDDRHYNAVPMPVLSLAFADAVDRIPRGLRPPVAAEVRAACAAAAGLALTTVEPLSALTDPAAYRKGTGAVAAERPPARARRRDGATARRRDGGGERRPGEPAHLALHGLPDRRSAQSRAGVHLSEVHLSGHPLGWVRDPVAYAADPQSRARCRLVATAAGTCRR
ncbi:hypothetical protein [Streptomyces wuyuanensis]|uniref:hypothetical protein n=1 Tax=Streptomyces wuyuanensis TaxID=1196353 RepID=UPI003D70463A